jgi:glutamine cyclotransferase
MTAMPKTINVRHSNPAVLEKFAKKMLISILFFWPIMEHGWAETNAKEYQYTVIKSYPHNTDSFTQGLEFHRGFLYEGTGKRGESKIVKRRLNSIRARKISLLADNLFGEGITVFNEKVYQLTWKAQSGFVYDAKNLNLVSRFSYSGEGWGLTNNGKELILSNGSDTLQFINPDDFSVSRVISVTLNGKSISLLNELEWVNGSIYANIWQSNLLVIIEPATGEISGYVDLSNLLAKELTTSKTDVLNGIAYGADHQRLLVTGKYWPRIFHIELTDNTP